MIHDCFRGFPTTLRWGFRWKTSGEWVDIDVQMDLRLSDRLLRKGTAGRNRKKTKCLKANLHPQSEAHLEGMDGRTDLPDHKSYLT